MAAMARCCNSRDVKEGRCRTIGTSEDGCYVGEHRRRGQRQALRQADRTPGKLAALRLLATGDEGRGFFFVSVIKQFFYNSNEAVSEGKDYV